jgi:hypothetical protein
MANEVVCQVSDVLIGAYGAAIGACTSLGGCEEAEMVASAAASYATDHTGRKRKGYESDKNYQINLVGLTAIAKQNLAYAIGGTVATDEINSTGSAAIMTEYTCYITGMFSDGGLHTLHAFKVLIPTDGAWKQSKEQTKLDLTLELMYDTTASLFWETTAGATDTTPPTVSTVSPADGTTAVAKAATTLVVWTFSEAIRSEDVTAANFFVLAALDAAVVAGTVAVSDALNKEVTFTPTGAYGATTAYVAVANKGVRDVAGNAMAAQHVTDFVTGA